MSPSAVGTLETAAPTGLDSVRTVALPRVDDPRGRLTFVESGRHVPFDIRRVYYLYDVPGDEVRGGHAHRELEQVLIAVSGSFEVVLNDGERERVVTLDRPDQGLYVARLVWRELRAFSPGAVCLVLASLPYDEADYYRSFADFRAAVRR